MMDLQRIVGDFKAPAPTLRLRFGEIISDDTGTVTITVAGSTVEISGVRYLDSYTPTAMDTVVLLTDGLDVLVLGKVA